MLLDIGFNLLTRVQKSAQNCLRAIFRHGNHYYRNRKIGSGKISWRLKSGWSVKIEDFRISLYDQLYHSTQGKLLMQA